MRSEESKTDLANLVATKEIVVTCGPGGVGKTTVAAAFAAGAASRGAKVLVLTVDPARRLADALGLNALGNQAVRIPPDVFTTGKVKTKGELWAAMLDPGEAWDDLVRHHAPDQETQSAILTNPLYRDITARFAHGQEYVAMEKLYEIHAAGDYDLLVVDTPPATHALDLLDAPDRMVSFFTSKLLKLLVIPHRSRLAGIASRPFYQVADRLLGMQFLGEISEFFRLFETMYDGFVERAKQVRALLGDSRTTFMVVTTPEFGPVTETIEFAKELQRRNLQLGALVVNKVLPAYFANGDGSAVADTLLHQSHDIANSLAGVLDAHIPVVGGASPTEHVEQVLIEIASSFQRYCDVARRENEQARRLGEIDEKVLSLPFLTSGVMDVSCLVQMGEMIFAS